MIFKQFLAGAALIALHIGTAHANPYAVTVTEGLTGGNGFNTLNQSPFTPGAANTATASFSYTGPLSFNDTYPQNNGATGDLNSTFGFSTSNVSNYAGAGTVTMNANPIANYTNLTNFLTSSGSAGGFQYGSYYTFDLGTLAAGTILDITHDDGASVFQGSTQIGSTVSGPTSAVTDHVTLSKSADTILYYSRQNGTPSILDVAVPEPASYALFGVGLCGLVLARRRVARA